MYRYWVHFPGDAYGINFDFTEKKTMQEFREYLRQFFGLKRLPNGTEVWK